MVWSATTDLRRWGEWNTLFTKWKGEVPDSLAAGTQIAAVLTIMGMANTITLTADEYHPPVRVRISGTGMDNTKVSLTLSADADGDTSHMKACADFESQMMVGAIGKAIGKAIEPATEKELDSSLDKLATIAR